MKTITVNRRILTQSTPKWEIDKHGLIHQARFPEESLEGIEIVHVQFAESEQLAISPDLWATPIRALILSRLSQENGGWWLSMEGTVRVKLAVGNLIHPLDEWLSKMAGEIAGNPRVPRQYRQSTIANHHRREFLLFPGNTVATVVNQHWANAHQGVPIYGCCVNLDHDPAWAFEASNNGPIGLVSLLDKSRCLLVTFPAENSDLLIVVAPSKASQIVELIDVADLEKRVADIEQHSK